MSGMTSTRAARAFAAVAVALAAILATATIICDVLVAESGGTTVVAPGWTGFAPGLALVVTGALLQWRVGWHPVALVMLGLGLLYCMSGLGAAWVNVFAALWPGAPFAVVAFIVNQRVSGFALLAIPTILLIFPTGRLPERRDGRVLAGVSIALCVTPIVVLALMPWQYLAEEFGRPDSSVLHWYRAGWGLRLTPQVWGVIADLAIPAIMLGVLCSALVLLGRRIGADPVTRQQLKWIAWAGLIFSVLFVLGLTVLPYHLGQIAWIAGVVLVCVAVLVAVARFRLYSIDRLMSWTLIYFVLIAAVVLVDVALIAVVGHVVGERMLALASAVLVLLVYAPLRERLLGWTTRLVNGRRGDRYGVVSALARRLEDSSDPDDQLAHLVGSVAKAFASPYVRVRVDNPEGGQLMATHGDGHDGETITMPLSYRGEPIGELQLAPGRRSVMSARDERLLADLVRQAAAAARATALSRELQAIREQLVTAREEARQRLRRDLHDGLGPTLAGIQLRVEAARNLADRDRAAMDSALDSAVEEITATISEVRRLSHGLRPPSLDDLGLEGALRQVCERFGEPVGPLDISFTFEVPQDLPAAVQVAAYRVVSEGLLNVHRHAQARAARVSVKLGRESLVIEVADDGVGIDPTAEAGLGMRSLRERAAELGGRLEVTGEASDGTLVRAVIPLRWSPPPVLSRSMGREESARV